MAEISVLDAMNHALENDGELLPEANAGIPTVKDDEEIDSKPAGETPEGEGTEEEAPAEEEVVEGEETEAEAEARGAERDPATGKFIKKGEKPAEEEKPAVEQKLDKDGKPIVEPKKADPVNDPIPKDLKRETRERIQTLIKTAKEKTDELTKVSTDFNYLVEGVKATGASPEQYGETLSWLALFNSQDPKQQEQALELVESVAERLATLLGKERHVGDPLAAHTDLTEAVRTGRATIEMAREVARTRNQNGFRTGLQNAQHEQRQQQQSFEQETQQARNSLTDLETTLKATDPEWAQKKPILVAALKDVFASIPPRDWRGKFEQAYRNLKLQAPASAARTSVPANQPMRAGKQPSGGASGGPASAVDAMSAALSSMGK